MRFECEVSSLRFLHPFSVDQESHQSEGDWSQDVEYHCTGPHAVHSSDGAALHHTTHNTCSSWQMVTTLEPPIT